MEQDENLIILVDDNPANLRIGKNILSKKYTVATVPSAEKLFSRLEHVRPSMILLDIDMPEMDGYEAIKILKAKPETADIPVIFLTARIESDDELEGLSLGAIDYITKPFQPSLLLKRIELHLLVVAQRKTLEKQAAELKFFNKNLHRAFSTYLSSEVVEEIVSDPAKLQLGGTKRRMTAMFTDVRNFTGISETLTPEELVELLNYYLSLMSDVILEHKGTIDKYVGDAIVSFFGAPLELAEHSLQACTSAILMKRLEGEMNKRIGEKGIPPLLTRIGINTGDMIVGNMGTQKKMNYTIISNAVNLASRLEGANKLYNTWILASEDTAKEAKDHILFRRLDWIRVVGINEPVRIYEALELKADATPAMQNKVELFHRAHTLFESRDWEGAQSGFRGVLKMHPDDGPSRLFLERCRECLKSPPPDDWDGVISLGEK